MSAGKSIGIVKLPRRARAGIDVLPWATEVNQCLQQLRDRAVTFKKSKAVLQTVAAQLILVAAGKNNSGEALIRVTPGLVNFLQPTLGGIALDADPFPTIEVTADVYVWVKVVGTFGDLDTYVVTIEEIATDTTPAGTTITATGFTSFYRLGEAEYIAAGEIVITKYHFGGNLGVDSWGLYNVWWKA